MILGRCCCSSVGLVATAAGVVVVGRSKAVQRMPERENGVLEHLQYDKTSSNIQPHTQAETHRHTQPSPIRTFWEQKPFHGVSSFIHQPQHTTLSNDHTSTTACPTNQKHEKGISSRFLVSNVVHSFFLEFE